MHPGPLNKFLSNDRSVGWNLIFSRQTSLTHQCERSERYRRAKLPQTKKTTTSRQLCGLVLCSALTENHNDISALSLCNVTGWGGGGGGGVRPHSRNGHSGVAEIERWSLQPRRDVEAI